MTLREAAQMALEVLSEILDTGGSFDAEESVAALRAALEQPALCDPAEYDDFQGAVSRNQSASRQS